MPQAAERELARQLAAQEKTAAISGGFLALEPQEVDGAIEVHLATAAEIAEADVARLVVVSQSRGEPLRGYEWCGDGAIPRLPYPVEGEPRFRWSGAILRSGRTLHVPSWRALPAEASPEREAFQRRNVLSMLSIPIRTGPSHVGYLIFERVQHEKGWSDREQTQLRLVGEIFATAIKRRRTEVALRESEERFRKMAENAAEVVSEFDARGRYRYVSPSFNEHLGYEREELLGRDASELVHPDDLRGVSARFQESYARGDAGHGVYRLRHKDGSWRWYEVSGRAFRGVDDELRFVSTGRDITERVEMSEALARQRAVEAQVAELSRRFLGLEAGEIDAAIVEALGEAAGIAGADRSFVVSFARRLDGTLESYEWCGPGTSAGSGLDEGLSWATARALAGEVLNVPVVADLPPEAAAERQHLERRGVRSLLGIPVHSGERAIGYLAFEAVRAERRWSEHELTALRLIGELLAAALARQRVETRLRDSHAQLLQAQKLEAVGRLAGGIAHDFNNLLTVILGFSRPLLRELDESDPIRDDVREIHDSAERAAALTRQLLTFSRRQPVRSQSIDLSRTVRGLEHLLSRLLGDDVELALELAADLPPVEVDPHQFEQLLINLAVNARDAMAEGGSLVIRTESRDVDAASATRMGLANAGSHVVIRVTDTGCGIDDETRVHIFDPFFTTKEPGKGTGLGLSIVYSTVEQAGGAIQVYGERGKGTTFEIFVPRAVSAVEEGDWGPADPPVGAQVLVVEDLSSVRRLTRRILERSGYRVLEAEDGMAAIERANAVEGRIDLVVTDVVMPRLGGQALAERLREQWPGLRVLFVSGHPADDAGDASPIPASDFLHKPFSEGALLAKVRDLLA